MQKGDESGRWEKEIPENSKNTKSYKTEKDSRLTHVLVSQVVE